MSEDLALLIIQAIKRGHKQTLAEIEQIERKLKEKKEKEK